MNPKIVLNKIKTALNMEVKLEQMKLDNGTVLEAEVFEAGAEVFIITEDARVAVPVGEYTFEDGKILIVLEEGLIAEIKDAKEPEAEMPEEEKAVEEAPELEVEKPVKKIVESISKEMHFSEEQTNEIKEMFVAFKKELLEELKPQELTELKAEEVEKVEPIKASPEALVEKKEMHTFGKNNSLESRIFKNIDNFKINKN